MAEAVEFYDVKSKEKFTTDDYEFRIKNGRYFAVTKAPAGHEAWRVVSKDFANNPTQSDVKVVQDDAASDDSDE